VNNIIVDKIETAREKKETYNVLLMYLSIRYCCSSK
jgi:hypothetical protein